MGFESISEPDDIDFDDEDDVAAVDGNEEEEEEEAGEVVDVERGGAIPAGEEGDSEKFFDNCSRSSASAGSTGHRHRSPKSDDVDTEDDPAEPVTPGPNSRFDIVEPPLRKGRREEERHVDEYREFEDEDDGGGDGDDIEDDWVDPSLPTSTPTRPLPKLS